LLIPEQKVVLVPDPAQARRIGRANVSRLLRLPNTRAVCVGWAPEEDFADGGSDRLIGALVVWGDVGTSPPGSGNHDLKRRSHVALRCSPPTPPPAAGMARARALLIEFSMCCEEPRVFGSGRNRVGPALGGSLLLLDVFLDDRERRA
jgi:hypothetical protein